SVSASPAPVAPIVYRLASSVPDYWIPLVPTRDRGSFWLTRAAMMRSLPNGSREAIKPLGRILEPETSTLGIYEEEVPRAGIRVTRTYQYVRAPDGSTFLWLGRRKRSGRGEGSSGLRFDV